jgi:hypothetical protein
MSSKYTIVGGEGDETVVAYIDGEMYTANQDHPNYGRILDILRWPNGENVVDLFDVAKTVARKFTYLSERVAVNNGVITFDGDPIHSALTEHILRLLDADEEFVSVVNFWELLEQNPNEHARENLYRWLSASEFTLTEYGYIVAYKGVQAGIDDLGEPCYWSINSGTAIVDGEEVDGQVPNNVGSIVEMPRSSVEFDPAVGCSTGLHAGTEAYARGFARGAVLTVEINPRDVVSVPTDSSDQKMRVCRYLVTGATEHKVETPVSSGWGAEWDFLDEALDDLCDCGWTTVEDCDCEDEDCGPDCTC